MPDLLFLMQRLPYPLIKGEKIRNWHILNYLTKWYDIHFGCLIDDPVDFQHIDTVRALCKDMYTAPLDRKRAKLTCASGLLTGEPLSVAFFRDRGLRRWVEDVMTRVKPEMTFVNSSNMAPYILDLPRTGRRIVELGDVDSEKFLSYSETAGTPMRQIYRREWRLVRQLERRIALECDRSVFVTEAEATLFRTMVPEATDKVVGISCGVDHVYFNPAHDYPAPFDTASPSFVFTGTMDYAPNIDAVSWFATKVLPLIRRARSGARFFIVGSNPAEEVKRLAKLDGVTVTGRVPDVRPYVFHATAAVGPMRIARGIQNKVLEAMAMSKPVIVTSGALEGIDATPGREVILADDAETFADAAIRLASADGAATPEGAALGLAARRLILERYDWDACLSGFDDLMRPAFIPPSRTIARKASDWMGSERMEAEPTGADRMEPDRTGANRTGVHLTAASLSGSGRTGAGS
jgi:sugar transferase (PEP-CTERM/EpsH1 system associated)